MVRHIFPFMLLALSATASLAQKDMTWLQRWAGSGTTYQEDWARDIALDDSGNIYVTGACNAGGTGALYVTLKYSSGGRLRWERLYGEATYNQAHAIAIDPSCNAWVTGESGGSATRDIYTVAYGPEGNVVWQGRFDFGGGTDLGEDIAVSKTGDVAVTGYASRGGAPVLFHGTTDWSRQVPGMWGQAIDVSRSAVTVAGTEGGSFGAIRYDLQGNLLWHSKSGSAVGGYSVAVTSLAVDSSGNSYVTGTTGDLYTVSFDPGGNVRWSALYIGPRLEEGTGIALDSKGNVITAGSTDQSTGNYYAFRGLVMKHDSLGNALWTKVLDFGGVNEHISTMAVGRGDTIYIAGDRYASASVDADYLIAKLSPDGDLVWWTTYAGNGASYSTASAIATDTSGGLYVTGWSSQNNDWPDNADIVTIKFWGRKLFRPDPDGWQFANTAENMWPETWWSQFDYTKPPYPFFLSWPPINATSADFPDWPLFVNVYGTDQCYKMAGDGSYYFVPSALLKWRSMVGMMQKRDKAGNVTSHWHGSCAGFALSALLYYNDMLSLQWTLGDYKSVYEVPISDESRYLVNKYYTTYLGNLKGGNTLTGPEALNALKAMLVDSYTNDQFLCICDPTGAAHAVVACSLAAIGSGWWELSIYDPNYPGTYMHLNYSEITEGWNAQEQGWGDLWLWLQSIESDSRTPILSLACKGSVVPGAASDSSTDVFNSPYVDIRIRNASGQTIGYADGALIDSMPGAQPRLNLGGNGTPPGGYFLPAGDYTAQIGKSLDSTTYFTMFAESSAFSFHRQGGKPADREMLCFSTSGKNLSAINPDPTTKTFFLQCIERFSGEETVCRLRVQAMPPADSIGIQLVGNRNVALFVGTAGLTADLRLELVKDYANPVFEYAELSLETGASYRVAPVWDSLATLPLRIYVDRDRDGTVDDTLHLENQTTGVPQGRGELIPDHYELQQNYPNPFNSGTLLTYKVPEKSNVRLSVYDILGREVAVLVDEVKAPGIYTVRLDASSLSSGVYLCRLTAGLYAKTVKMALIR